MPPWKIPGFPPKVRLPSTTNTIPVPEPKYCRAFNLIQSSITTCMCACCVVVPPHAIQQQQANSFYVVRTLFFFSSWHFVRPRRDMYFVSCVSKDRYRGDPTVRAIIIIKAPIKPRIISTWVQSRTHTAPRVKYGGGRASHSKVPTERYTEYIFYCFVW